MTAFFFPKLYREYVDNMSALLGEHPHLERAHPESIFAAASLNFGRAVSFEHTDFGNKANGVCPIWCGGDFDFRKGGHLILRQIKLVVQFPRVR